MGSPISPIVANLYMEYFDQKALSTAPQPQALVQVCGWHICHPQGNPQTGFSTTHQQCRTLPFSLQWRTIKRMGPSLLLDTIVKPEADGNLSITVYWKPTHTDQYLQWDSHHHLSATFRVIHILSPRVQTVCSDPELLRKEKTHLRNALTQCKYSKWTFDRVERRLNKLSSETSDGANNQSTQVPNLLPMKLKPKVTLLYPTQKVSVKVSRRYVIGMAYRPTSKVVIPSETY